MENLERLLKKYQEDERTDLLASYCEANTPARIMIEGLVGAQDCFVLSALFSRSGYSQIFLKPFQPDSRIQVIPKFLLQMIKKKPPISKIH